MDVFCSTNITAAVFWRDGVTGLMQLFRPDVVSPFQCRCFTVTDPTGGGVPYSFATAAGGEGLLQKCSSPRIRDDELGGQYQTKVQHQQTVLQQKGHNTKKRHWKLRFSFRSCVFGGAYLEGLFPHGVLYVFERLVVIQQVLSTNHIHLQEHISVLRKTVRLRPAASTVCELSCEAGRLTWQVVLSSIFLLMNSSTWRIVASPDTRTPPGDSEAAQMLEAGQAGGGK
ncbi:hypothetical protein EYF80_024344 [Liparis tanakae]|uniref:Uncharacterized protein n=1 Tax=Liparis tanakae TaxID=230148 RepID=A0A4Z2HKG8_9TELE|nr:hypothetical protein EYF80_024344 [Liparis tanakae]